MIHWCIKGTGRRSTKIYSNLHGNMGIVQKFSSGNSIFGNMAMSCKLQMCILMKPCLLERDRRYESALLYFLTIVCVGAVWSPLSLVFMSILQFHFFHVRYSLLKSIPLASLPPCDQGAATLGPPDDILLYHGDVIVSNVDSFAPFHKCYANSDLLKPG